MKRAATRARHAAGVPRRIVRRAHARPHGLARHGRAARQRSARSTCACARRRGSSAALGLSYGSSSWYAVLSDFSVMRKGAMLAVSSSQLASLAIKEAVDPEELGGWRLHAEVTGFADQVVDTDEEALDAIKTFLSYLPGHHNEAPPVRAVPPGSGEAMARHRQAAAREAHAGLRHAQDHPRDRRQGQLLRAEGALRQGRA